MPKLSISIPHELERDEVMRRMKASRKVVEEFEQAGARTLSETWSDYGYQMVTELMKQEISLEISAEEERCVRAEVELPMMLMLAQGIIREKLEGGLRQMLSSGAPVTE
ncbi:MAG: hypothetical protein Q4C47_08615 [Planctomycetia bacterium]|nr:hypothetical protein [Planctomycetia bacterium]